MNKYEYESRVLSFLEKNNSRRGGGVGGKGSKYTIYTPAWSTSLDELLRLIRGEAKISLSRSTNCSTALLFFITSSVGNNTSSSSLMKSLFTFGTSPNLLTAENLDVPVDLTSNELLDGDERRYFPLQFMVLI